MKANFDPTTRLATLIAENDADRDVLGEMYHDNNIQIDRFISEPVRPGVKRVEGVVLTFDHADPRSLRTKAGREALCALGQLFSLGLSEAASHGLIGRPAANPELQKKAAAGFEELKVVPQASGSKVLDGQVDKMIRSHSTSLRQADKEDARADAPMSERSES